MAERSPVARSPIAPADPIETVAGWEVSSVRSESALRIADLTPLAKVGVRADSEGNLAAELRVPLGEARRGPDNSLVVGSGPGEWLLLSAPGSAPAVLDRIQRRVGEEFASVLDLTHAGALIRLTGDAAADLLAKLCAIDLSDDMTPNGSALRTFVARLVTDLIREDENGVRSYWLHCEWSSGQYLFDALLDAGKEFGIAVDGFRQSA